jgi:hypothetical protein
MSDDLGWVLILIVIFCIILGRFFIAFTCKCNYDVGYKNGQTDYIKGIIKYKVIEVTSDKIIKDIK